ncbi:MAG: TRAP transporter small permease [Balneolaceae bacterium]|nr:MAG: TRAP transporter small permease [Balneolaceae bacterium]
MRKIVDKATRGTLIFLMAFLVINVVWQVFSRYILNAPSTFTDELARFLLIWVSLLGVAYLSGQNAHISIDLLQNKLNPAGKMRLQILINSLIIAFAFFVLVVGGGHLVYLTFVFTQLTPTLQIPMAYIYLIGPICGLLVIYYKLSDIRRLLSDGYDTFPADLDKSRIQTGP